MWWSSTDITPARVVQVVGAAWLDSIRTALASHEAPSDVVSVVEQVAYAAEAGVFGVKVDEAISDAEMDW